MQSTVFTISIVKLCLTLHGITAVLAELPSPSNIRINSVNLGLVLEWDAPQNHTENITYRAEYKFRLSQLKCTYDKTYRPLHALALVSGSVVVCLNTTAQSCDFTSHLNQFGVYVFQVRAEREGDTSQWMKTKKFVMDEHTALGPPGVTLVSSGVDIEVSIKDPVLRISKFKDVYNHATFNITYWKEGQEETAKRLNGTQQCKVVLALEPWTRYCVQVWVYTQRFSKHSQPSNVTCESTTKGNDRPWVVALVTFVVMAVAVALLALAFWYSYRVVRFLRPKAKLPEHFTELLDPPCSSILAMQSSPQPEEVYHKVSIMPGGAETEVPSTWWSEERNTHRLADNAEKGCVPRVSKLRCIV